MTLVWALERVRLRETGRAECREQQAPEATGLGAPGLRGPLGQKDLSAPLGPPGPVLHRAFQLPTPFPVGRKGLPQQWRMGLFWL